MNKYVFTPYGFSPQLLKIICLLSFIKFFICKDLITMSKINVKRGQINDEDLFNKQIIIS